MNTIVLMQAGLTALMIASQIGDVEIFDLLLENHADVMKKSRVGFVYF